MKSNVLHLNKQIQTSVPELTDLFSIRRADSLQYQLSELEVKRTRRHIYKINKNDPRGRRFRTMLEIDILTVWRVN